MTLIGTMVANIVTNYCDISKEIPIVKLEKKNGATNFAISVLLLNFGAKMRTRIGVV